MKNLFSLISLLGFTLIFSQETAVTKTQTSNVFTTDSIIYEEVDKMPMYPGGINAFRKNFSQTFDGSKINARGMIKSEAQFVISKEGIITDIMQ